MSIPPAGYPATVYTPELQPKEHAFALYPLQVTEPYPEANQRSIGGYNCIINWVVYDVATPVADTKPVARLQGIFFSASCSIVDVVFIDGRFPSTLKLAGQIEGPNEVAIIGGTGEFAMAQGIVKAKNLKRTSTGNLIEYQIRAMVPTLAKPNPTPVTKDGPWGGNAGNELDVTELPVRLESLTIGSGDFVDSLEFSYVDKAGNRHTAGPWGGPGGDKATIQFDPTETVSKIVGTTGDFEGNTVVTSISITTNKKTYGPYGKEKGKYFNNTDGNSIIVGFYVRAGLFVHNLGVYARKN
ncbi:unnamed protein product [Alopecurus aequalis]